LPRKEGKLRRGFEEGGRRGEGTKHHPNRLTDFPNLWGGKFFEEGRKRDGRQADEQGGRKEGTFSFTGEGKHGLLALRRKGKRSSFGACCKGKKRRSIFEEIIPIFLGKKKNGRSTASCEEGKEKSEKRGPQRQKKGRTARRGSCPSPPLKKEEKEDCCLTDGEKKKKGACALTRT